MLPVCKRWETCLYDEKRGAELWPLCPAPSLLPACSRRYALPSPQLPRFVLLAPSLAPAGSPVSLLLGCHGTNLSRVERVPGAGWKCQGLGAHGACLHRDCVWLRLIWGMRLVLERCGVCTSGMSRHSTFCAASVRGGRRKLSASNQGLLLCFAFSPLKRGLSQPWLLEEIVI